VYGFDLAHDLGTLVEAALQVCPLVAALCLLVAAPLRERLGLRLAAYGAGTPTPSPGARLLAVLAVSLGSAAFFLALTMAAVLLVAGGPIVPSSVSTHTYRSFGFSIGFLGS